MYMSYISVKRGIFNIGHIQNRYIIRYILYLQFSYFLTLSIQIF